MNDIELFQIDEREIELEARRLRAEAIARHLGTLRVRIAALFGTTKTVAKPAA